MTQHRGKTYDALLDQLLAKSPNMAVPYFLAASWGYYHGDFSILSDERYDQLARDIDTNWDKLFHMHKPVIDRAGLKAGTAYSVPDAAYPLRVVMMACQLGGAPLPPLIERAQYGTLPRPRTRVRPGTPPPPEKPKRGIPDFWKDTP